MSGSGAEADTEGQGSQMEYTPRGKETKTVDDEKASGDKAQPAVPALVNISFQNPHL
jgi:hypothetical protein